MPIQGKLFIDFWMYMPIWLANRYTLTINGQKTGKPHSSFFGLICMVIALKTPKSSPSSNWYVHCTANFSKILYGICHQFRFGKPHSSIFGLICMVIALKTPKSSPSSNWYVHCTANFSKILYGICHQFRFVDFERKIKKMMPKAFLACLCKI